MRSMGALHRFGVVLGAALIVTAAGHALTPARPDNHRLTRVNDGDGGDHRLPAIENGRVPPANRASGPANPPAGLSAALRGPKAAESGPR
jgi:hypothetical protein